MKTKFKDLIKKIVASSVAAIASSYGAQAAPDIVYNDMDDESVEDKKISSKKELSKKLILNMVSNDDYYLSAHRSHSSHRSHRSHSSHRSGSSHYSSSHTSHYSSSSVTKSTKPSSTKTISKSTTTYSKTNTSSTQGATYGIYSGKVSSASTLGSRDISLNMTGVDVNEAAECLVKLKYASSNMFNKNSNGDIIYDDLMIGCVTRYKKDRGFPTETQLSKTVAFQLKKDADNYIELGERLISLETLGTDVTELRNLLIDKGYLKGKKKGKFEITEFDQTLFDILEVFLSDNNYNWSSVVNSDIIKLLKK